MRQGGVEVHAVARPQGHRALRELQLGGALVDEEVLLPRVGLERRVDRIRRRVHHERHHPLVGQTGRDALVAGVARTGPGAHLGPLVGPDHGDQLGLHLVREQPADIDVQRVREFERGRDRRVAEAAFHLGQIALGHPDPLRQCLQTEPVLLPQHPHPAAHVPPLTTCRRGMDRSSIPPGPGLPTRARRPPTAPDGPGPRDPGDTP